MPGLDVIVQEQTKEYLSVLVSGKEGAPLLFMLSGWPDDHSTWDDVMPLLENDYRCARAVPPDFDKSKPSTRWGFSFDQVIQMIDASVERFIASEGGAADTRVTLVLHDWGCFYGYLYAERRPQRVVRVVALDIGCALGIKGSQKLVAPPSLRNAFAIVPYQAVLATSFAVGALLGTWAGDLCLMFGGALLFLTGANPCPKDTPKNLPRFKKFLRHLHCWKCYPYYYAVRGFITSTLPLPLLPVCPTLFIYGKNKTAVFHTQQLIKELEERKDGSAAIGLDCGHFIQQWVPHKLALLIREFCTGRRIICPL